MYRKISRPLLFHVLLFMLSISPIATLHLSGTWRTSNFFVFLAKFGFQQTDIHDKDNTQGYIYGNITSKQNHTHKINFVVVDSEYFLNYYKNSAVKSQLPGNHKSKCIKMFKKIDTIAWDVKCHPNGPEDFLRKIPCPVGQLCTDEDTPHRVVKGHQFTFSIQDTGQPRFWYISMVSCFLNSSNPVCEWTHNAEDIEIEYDIWLVNGSPYTKHVNPFEHQFSFELHDVVELYFVFFMLYNLVLPLQVFAFRKKKHPLAKMLTLCIILEYVGIVCNLFHFFIFAFNGRGVGPIMILGNFIDMIAQCLLMLLLLLVAKGWTITKKTIDYKQILLVMWGLYTAFYTSFFIWNLIEVEVISATDEWQTWPGYLILISRFLICIWFLVELRRSFKSEVDQEKISFYLHFGAGYLVWLVYLPILAGISTQISALWRHKSVLSVTYGADFMAYLVLIHIMWPTRDANMFNYESNSGRVRRIQDALGPIEYKTLLEESEESEYEKSPQHSTINNGTSSKRRHTNGIGATLIDPEED